MNDEGIGWESLLHTDAPPQCSLQGALFTTYDRADERLLVEHLLPMLLKLGREPDGEGVERQYFLLELDMRLKQLHDRLVVVSSAAREEPRDLEEGEGGNYGWIWLFVRHLTVGYHGKAVQHAKLWLLHWGAEDTEDEYLEVVVSSANLTRAAFRGQLQAAWRTCVKLHRVGSQARLASWGLLPKFLDELASHADDNTRLSHFTGLLSRAECPKDVLFVASVPGKHSRKTLRRTPWGAAGLARIAPAGRGTVSVVICSPYVGSWTADALRYWCSCFGGATARTSLVWIDKDHPWARTGKWLLPESTLSELRQHDATLLRLHHEPNDPVHTDLFHKEHRATDDRWSHAKLYSFKRGNSRCLLVTSANFSPAAWGRLSDNGDLIIENFELGVCIRQHNWPFEWLDAFDSDQRIATVTDLPSRGNTQITWARAAWDGREVHVDCRCLSDQPLTGKITPEGKSSIVKTWNIGQTNQHRSAQVPWTLAESPPLDVVLTCEGDSLCITVFDERPSSERDASLPPEVDEDIATLMRDQLLFEQYGGRVAADGDLPTSGEGDESVEESGELNDEVGPEGIEHKDSYAVPAFVQARSHLRVVDSWAQKAENISTSEGSFSRELLRRDCALLIEAFRRQAEREAKSDSAWAIGATIAAEEMAVRLRHFGDA